jgi:CRISPR-associated protein Cmr4
MEAKLLLIQALSPLHAGTGQGVGVIDLPIAREKATNIPFLPGSTLKGVFRDACDTGSRDKIFGPDTNNADLYAGAVNFTDARLLLLPVRSLRGVFAWVTCPLLLRRLLRDAQDVPAAGLPGAIPTPGSDDHCKVAGQNSALTMRLNNTDQVVLEDLPISAIASTEVSQWATWLAAKLYPQNPDWLPILTSRLCVVSDDVFAFLLETATEITARIAMDDDKKTVKRGALWYEEALPSEAVLASLVVAVNLQATSTEVFQTIQSLTNKTMQFGGDATVGRGLCKAHLV